jgi:hypothetical protein
MKPIKSYQFNKKSFLCSFTNNTKKVHSSEIKIGVVFYSLLKKRSTYGKNAQQNSNFIINLHIFNI